MRTKVAKNMSFDVKNLGQVFTQPKTVQAMLDLRKNFGSILEPSSGTGAFWNRINQEKHAFAVEYDHKLCPDDVCCADFFQLKELQRTFGCNLPAFDTILGNPPYVAYKNILPPTKTLLEKNFPAHHKKTNLFLFFIDYCIDLLAENGELILIVPIEFVNQTSSVELNKKIYKQGTITHFYDLGDQKVFDKFSPNCCIFRFEKGNFSRKTIINGNEEKNFLCKDGRLFFSSASFDAALGDLFTVYVGAVSGMDQVFAHESGTTEFVGSFTKKTGKTKRYIYDEITPHLEAHKEALINRRIKNFSEDNWWKWGRQMHRQLSPSQDRIYVNCKTRDVSPFFLHSCKKFDGSVLALVPRVDTLELDTCVEVLNNMNWSELGFKVGGRLTFGQRTLQMCPMEKNKFFGENK